MTRQVRIAGLALAAALFAIPAGAATWDCTFNPSRGNGTPERVIVQIDANTGVARVNDPIIQNYVGHPVEAQLRANTASRLTLRWELPSVKDARGNWIPGVVYTLTSDKSTGAARISGRPNGNYKEVSSTGSCKAR